MADRTFSERQRAWAAHWRSRSVYTPGFVLAGKEWRGWASREELPRAARTPTGLLTARSDDGWRWTLRFAPADTNSPASFDFHAALLGFDLAFDVKAGENRGRKLEHDFVVLAMANTASNKSGDGCEGLLSMKPPSRILSKRLALAAWVTPSKGLQPLQTVGGWLASTNR